jgi:hypothetical protein
MWGHHTDHATHPLSTKVGTKIRQPVAVAPPVSFLCGLRAMEFVFVLFCTPTLL